MIGGLTTHYPDTIRPALQVIDVRPELREVAGVYVLITAKGDIYFLADATVNIEPTAEDLAEIAIMAAEKARRFNQEPRVAMLSFSNFGSTRHPLAEKVRRAVELVRQRAPGLMIDGEMQADTAVVPQIIDETYPFSTLKGGANVLIFPNLEAGNIAYKLLQRIGGAEADRPAADRPLEAGPRPAARLRSQRHRARGGRGRGGRAGGRQTLPHHRAGGAVGKTDHRLSWSVTLRQNTMAGRQESIVCLTSPALGYFFLAGSAFLFAGDGAGSGPTRSMVTLISLTGTLGRMPPSGRCLPGTREMAFTTSCPSTTWPKMV